MSKENFLNRIKYLPETTKQFGGLVLILLIISPIRLGLLLTQIQLIQDYS